MPKRLHDNLIWKKKWFRELPPELKLVWFYMKDECDISGVWIVDEELAEFCINKKIDWNKAFKAIKDQVFLFRCGKKCLIIDFIDFQYGKLNQKSPVHRKVIDTLNKHGITEKILNRVRNRVRHTLCNTLQEEEEEEEEEKDKEKEKEIVIPEHLTNVINAFKEHRKKLGKKISGYGIELLLKKLNRLSQDKNEQVAIVQQSIDEGWQSVYELKRNNYERSNGKNKQDNGIASEYADI